MNCNVPELPAGPRVTPTRIRHIDMRENVRASGRVGESDLELGLGLLEVRRRFAGWFGLRADAGVRRDGGAGQTGTGLELAGGLRIAGGPVRLDTQGRILATHSAQDYSERGLGVTLTVGNPSAGGVLLTVSSRWGGPAAGNGALWEARLHELRRDAPDASWSFDARVRWVPRVPGRD